jgi:predicted CoA-substrate-specific enzyme activase
MKPLYIGIDAGSVSAKVAVTDAQGNIITEKYVLHRGNPLGACENLCREAGIAEGIFCVTGSARKLIGRSTSSHLVKNEITAVWRSVSSAYPDARTILEIGGQDSKLVTLEDGEISGFRLNSVCAAGTGSFIQQQANRLGMSIEELSSHATNCGTPARFTGRCTVFAETEMINLQQRGFGIDAIAAGLSDAIVENYLKDLSPGMKLKGPFIFCGGVAAIESVSRAFEKRLGEPMIRPDFFRIAGAYGAALLVRDLAGKNAEIRPKPLSFTPLETMISSGSACEDCLNCGRCGKSG